MAQDSMSLFEGQTTATMTVKDIDGVRTYELTSNAKLRENHPPEQRITFFEATSHATARTGNVMFDGLYAMAVHEALQNSVSQIKDGCLWQRRPHSD